MIDSPYASYVFDEKKMDNFTRMLEPLLAKDDAAKEKPKKEKAAKKDEKKAAEPSGTPAFGSGVPSCFFVFQQTQTTQPKE